MRTKPTAILLAIAILLLPAIGRANDDAGAILKTTGLRGGLGLVIGASDTDLAKALAAKSELYVQLLQGEPKTAAKWGAELAAKGFADREKLGVRGAAFNAENYGSDLFNLVVVEDPAGLGEAKLADLFRILVPRGFVAFKNPPATHADQAKALKMDAVAIDGFPAAYRKPTRTFEWRPTDSLKWRAGMRAHMWIGIGGPTHGGGKFFYREWLEAKDGWPTGRSRLYARDAFNGRVLWSREGPVNWKRWRVGQYTHRNWCLGADSAGRLFAVTLDGKFVCLDGATGEQRFELMASGAALGYVRPVRDKYVLFAGKVFDAATGKRLWAWRGKYTTVHKDTLVVSDGATLTVRKLADGAEVFKTTLPWRAGRERKPMGLLHVGSHIIVTEGHRWERPYRVTALAADTGTVAWTRELGGTFALPAHGEKGKTFAAHVRYSKLDEKLLIHAKTSYFFDRYPNQKEIRFARIDLATGKVEDEDYGLKAKLHGNACGTDTPQRLGDWLYYHHNVWLNVRTMERRFPYLVHPGCSLAPQAAYGMIYNSPGRKGHSIQGITAIGPADITFDQAPGGKVFHRYAPRTAFAEPTKATDWPTFRGNNARGNAAAVDLGPKLREAWSVKIGLGGRSYGQMYAQRTGLTQPVIAYGLAYVADIPAQRIVAVDVTDGREKWTRHIGSRVDFPPTIYKGLCLVASKDGFVTCLDAKTGQPVYRLLIAPRERYIGGQEKLESLWPTAADVMVDSDGVAHVAAGFATTAHGGYRTVSFKADTGEVVDSKTHHEPFAPAGYPRPKSHANIFTQPLKGGWRLAGVRLDDMLGFGNSISRTNEDRSHALLCDAPRRHESRLSGRVIAFDEKLCVAWNFPYGAASWANDKPLHLTAKAVAGRKAKPLWQSPPIELVADDLVLTPKHVYAVGHCRRVKGTPEVWTLSRADGKVLSKTPVPGFPSYMGSSASSDRLFVSTREGKLFCYQATAR